MPLTQAEQTELEELKAKRAELVNTTQRESVQQPILNKEELFRQEYSKTAKRLGLNPNPDDPRHFYNYRALFKETGSLSEGSQKHFPSKFKLLGHPNLIVDGKDTRTGKPATQKLREQNVEARKSILVTAEQARQELRRRAAVRELQRRQNRQPQQIPRGFQPGAIPGTISRTQPFESSQIGPGKPTFGQRVVEPIRERVFGLPPGAPLGTTGVLGEFAKRKGAALVSGVKEEGLPFVGETIGEIAGTAGGPKGRAFGAGLGRAAGQGLLQFLEGLVNSPNAPKTVKEAALNELKAFAVGAGTQVVGEKIFNVARRIGGVLGFKSSAVKPIPDLDELNRLAKGAGIDFTPAQKTTSRTIDTIEEMAENAFFGRGRIRNIKEIAQPSGVRRLVDNMLDSILPRAKRVGRGELGELLNDVILGKEKAFRRTGGVLYQKVDDLTRAQIKRVTVKKVKTGTSLKLGELVPISETIQKKIKKEVGGATVDLRSMKRFALSLQKERVKEGGTKKAVDDIINDILARPDFSGFKTAHNIRSDFLEIVRNAPSKKDRAVGVAKKASAMIDRQMQSAARRLSPEALKQWRIANAFWKNGKKTFNSRIVKRVTKTLAEETPDKIFDAVFRAKSPKQIKTVMDLANPLTQKRLRFAFVDNMVEQSSTQIPGDISDLRTLIGKRFIDKWDSFGDEALNAVFSKEQKQRIRNVARIAKATQGKAGGAGGFLIQLIQAGPIAGVAGGVITGEPAIAKKAAKGAFLLAGFTSGMSRLLASKRGSKILTDMMTVPPGTTQFANLAVRLTREMTGIRKEIEKEFRELKQDRRLIGLPGAKQAIATRRLQSLAGRNF